MFFRSVLAKGIEIIKYKVKDLFFNFYHDFFVLSTKKNQFVGKKFMPEGVQIFCPKLVKKYIAIQYTKLLMLEM